MSLCQEALRVRERLSTELKEAMAEYNVGKLQSAIQKCEAAGGFELEDAHRVLAEENAKHVTLLVRVGSCTCQSEFDFS